MAQAQGLVDIRRGRRPRVAVPSAEAAARVIGLTLRRTKSTLLQLAAAREALECQIARIAAVTAGPADLRRLQENIRGMEQNRTDLEACAARDLEFHSLILKATRNVVFEIMLSPVAELLKESRKRTLRLTGCEGRSKGTSSSWGPCRSATGRARPAPCRSTWRWQRKISGRRGAEAGAGGLLPTSNRNHYTAGDG